jgi:hypothetical protein
MVGAGLGPLVIATVTQSVLHDRNKLGVAMATVIPVAALSGAIVLSLGRRSYAEAIENKGKLPG